MHRVQKEFSDAERDAEAALSLGAGNPRYEYLLGRILLDAGEVENAAPHLTQAARVLTNQPDMQLDAASALARLGRFGEARPYFERAAALRPNDVKPVIGLMQLDAQEGKTEPAIARGRAFIARRPEIADTYLELGDLLLKLGRSDEARKVWQEGLERTDDPEIRSRLAEKAP
jgi:tetratricopeptide (TPR) repeat protein